MHDRSDRLELHPTQRLLLDLIRRHAPVTRAELTKLAGLTAGTITQQCRDLIFAGLVIEGERNTGQRGQPSLPLRLNPAGGCSVGIAFSPGFITVTIIDLTGKPLLTHAEPHEENQHLDLTLDQIRRLVDTLLKKRHLNNARILGAGYAIPGFLKADKLTRHCVSWLSSWRDIDLHKAFSENLPIPTWVENNANASAIGELYSGAWNPCSNITFIDIGYGIGAGIIVDDRLLRGGFFNAGEVGMAFPAGKPRPSYKDLILTLEDAGYRESDLSGMISEQSPFLEQWLTRSSDQIEQTILGCIQWVDPELIILGGAMPSAILSKLSDILTERVDQRLDAERPKATIVPSRMGADSASRGAAMLPLYNVLNTGLSM
ncbi:ROK family transcriptional regulator [Salmonella enterica]|nr:ROK family transcriptional regulator [Salmonella enterica]